MSIPDSERNLAERRQVPRMQHVADLAGVDQSIVSRVLRDDPRVNVRPETRERILEAARRLNYRPNAAAQTLRTARTMAIGMVIPDLANSIYAAIARGVEERAEPAGYVVLVAAGSAASRLGQVAGRVDGLLVAVATHESAPPTELSAESVPVVLVNRREDWGVPSVTVDDEAGAALATRHLLSLGHRRIAHLGGPRNADTALRRLRGYETAMRAAQIPSRDQLIVAASYDEAGGFAATSRVLSTTPRPTAIFAGNILAAIGAIAAARSCGLRVPEDVSVVGLHDIPIAGYLDPPVTTLRMPLEEMGRQAVDTLLRLLAGEPGVEHVAIASEPELVLRGSTAPPAAAP